MIQKSLVFCSLFVLSWGLYEHQIGLHDWHLQQFGKIAHLEFGSHNLYVQSDILVGAVSKNTGNVVYASEFPIGELFRCESYNQGSKFIKYDENQQRLFVYNPRDNTYQLVNLEVKEDKIISGCLAFPEDQMLVVFGQSAYLIEQTGVIKTLEVQGRVISSGFINQQATFLVHKAGNVCLISWSAQSFQERRCNVAAPGDYKINKLDVSYIYRDSSKAYQITLEKTVDLTKQQSLLQNALLFTNNYVISQENSKTYIYQFKGDSLSIFYELPSNAAYACHQDSCYYVQSDKTHANVSQVNLQTFQINLLGMIAIPEGTPQPFQLFVRQDGQSFLVQHKDLYTYFWQSIPTGQPPHWASEQGLYDTKGVLWEDFSNDSGHFRSDYFDQLEEHGSQNALYLIPHILTRLSGDFKDFIEYASNLPQKTINLFTSLRLSKEKLASSSKEYDTIYGLRQKIIFVTGQHNILCFDSEDGKFIWKDSSLINRMDSTYKLMGSVQIELLNIHRTDFEDKKPQLHYVLVYHSKVHERLNIFALDSITGIQQVASQKCSGILHITSYTAPSQHHHINPNVLLVITDDLNIVTYPRAPVEALELPQAVLYNLNENKDQINGYTFLQNQAAQVWNLKFKEEEILQIKSSKHKGEELLRVAIWDDRKVLFKLTDLANFAVLTRNNQSQSLNIYIVNGKNGKVIFQAIQKRVDFSLPINLLYDENSVYITYFNPEHSIYEIWSIEAFHSSIEVSFINMLTNYYFQHKEETHLNYFDEDPSVVFLQQVYGYTPGVKSLSVSKTLRSLTKKNLLIITSEGQLHSLDRNMISTRRRKNAQAPVSDTSFDSIELPPYQYLVPIDYKSFLSYQLKLRNLSKFHISSTNFESTSLLLLTGQDVFFTRISPDKTYDMIASDFNYSLLILTVVLIIAATWFIKGRAKVSKVIRTFYTG